VESDRFEVFVAAVEPRLRRAFAPQFGIDGTADAVADALAFAWEHWDRVRSMANPAGYLYRVGQTSLRLARRGPVALPSPAQLSLPEVEPALIPALLALPETQRTAVWLVHGCQWRYSEVAEAMGVSVSAVGTHVRRALDRLRQRLEVDSCA
jgi:DNA-directed RNA polymerase specialized sigma24 family protein